MLEATRRLFQIPQRYRFSSKSQRIRLNNSGKRCCFRYHKGTDFQANHNNLQGPLLNIQVVLDTTKVQIFKQITTVFTWIELLLRLFQIPQRYRFSSKSQHDMQGHIIGFCCFRYHKGTDFQANHNCQLLSHLSYFVVLDTTKVQIFKQITTIACCAYLQVMLFQIPQRYRFSSKSQLRHAYSSQMKGCFRYHKGTDFQANHN